MIHAPAVQVIWIGPPGITQLPYWHTSPSLVHAVPPSGRGSGQPLAGLSHAQSSPASSPFTTTTTVLVHAQSPWGYAHSALFVQVCPGVGRVLGHP
jgi:hypothetical protein